MMAVPVGGDVRSALPPFVDDFVGGSLGPEWIGIRRLPGAVARVEAGALVLDGEGRSMDDQMPTFVGRRVTRVRGRIAAVVEAGGSGTVGGLSLRYDERLHLDLERQPGRVVARTTLSTIHQEHVVEISDDPVELAFELRAPHPRSVSSDLIDLVVVQGGDRQVLTTVDGRFLSVELAGSFTGRVVGAYCKTGQLRVTHFEERDAPAS